jgi:hypothetical protein
MCYKIEYYYGCGHYKAEYTEPCSTYLDGGSCVMRISERQDRRKERQCHNCERQAREAAERERLKARSMSGP